MVRLATVKFFLTTNSFNSPGKFRSLFFVIVIAHKSGVVWIGDRLIKVGNADVSKGTIYDVPGIIAKMKRPLVMVLDGEHDIDLNRMDDFSVAVGMINQIQDDAKQNACDLVIDKIPPPKKRSLSSHPHHPPSPPYKVRKSLQAYAVKR